MPIEQEVNQQVATSEAAVVEEVVQQAQPEQVEQPSEEPKYTDTELQAMAQGWKPLDEWQGDPKDHRSAKEYLDRGELLGKIKAQSTQLTELRQMLAHMSEHNKKVYAAGYETALKELKTKRREAIKEGDFETVEALDEEIDSNKDALREIKETRAQDPQPQVNMELYQQWIKGNNWYLNDASLRHWANGMAIEYNKEVMRTEGRRASEDEIYGYLSTQVRKEFPHKFRGTVSKAPPSPDAKGRQVGGNKGATTAEKAFEDILSNMTEDEQKMARSLVKQGVLTKEKYVQDYKDVGGL